MSTVKIYDTTLRDGNQARGLSLSLNDKLLLAQKLNDFGVDYIEGGWPNRTNTIDTQFFKEVQKYGFKNSKIAAFGSTRRPKRKPQDDSILQDLVASQAPVFTIFGKSWDIHVTEVIRTELQENLDMISESIHWLKTQADEVIYDAEHFFDGYLANPEYALKTLEAAVQGGADCLVLCDTNGGMAETWEVERIVQLVKNKFGVNVGIHCHNDTGVAVINSMSAVRAGATQIQGTLNGYGERCGNANLITIIPNLVQKMHIPLQCAPQLSHLRKLSLEMDEIVNLTPDIRAPWVGEAAFAHKGGAHIDGVMKIQHSFEHTTPTSVGNDREFIISDQAGGSLVVGKLEKAVPHLDKKDPRVGEILNEVKDLESLGFHFETAAASFELLACKRLGLFNEPFEVLGYRVIEERKSNGLLISEATVKIKIGDSIRHRVAEGDGPVNALDAALRLALGEDFAIIQTASLENFKVRVLNSHAGSAAKVRVWAQFANEQNQTWETAGVSTNIIEASWNALLDGLNYAIHKQK